MFYAAKEFVAKGALRTGPAQSWLKGYREGWHEGRQLERERIKSAAAAQGVPIPPELARILAAAAE